MKTEKEIKDNIDKLLEQSKVLDKFNVEDYFKYRYVKAEISALTWALQ